MSIQSNTTQLQNEQTELQSLLDAVNALPDAGGGGASVETCTVTAEDIGVGNANYPFIVCATVFRNNQISVAFESFNAESVPTVTISDVVCGSTVSVFGMYGNGFYPVLTNMEYIGPGELSSDYIGVVLKAPTVAGATGKIETTSD